MAALAGGFSEGAASLTDTMAKQGHAWHLSPGVLRHSKQCRRHPSHTSIVAQTRQHTGWCNCAPVFRGCRRLVSVSRTLPEMSTAYAGCCKERSIATTVAGTSSPLRSVYHTGAPLSNSATLGGRSTAASASCGGAAATGAEASVAAAGVGAGALAAAPRVYASMPSTLALEPSAPDSLLLDSAAGDVSVWLPASITSLYMKCEYACNSEQVRLASMQRAPELEQPGCGSECYPLGSVRGDGAEHGVGDGQQRVGESRLEESIDRLLLLLRRQGRGVVIGR
jgi:hypothetical protein